MAEIEDRVKIFQDIVVDYRKTRGEYEDVSLRIQAEYAEVRHASQRVDEARQELKDALDDVNTQAADSTVLRDKLNAFNGAQGAEAGKTAQVDETKQAIEGMRRRVEALDAQLVEARDAVIASVHAVYKSARD